MRLMRENIALKAQVRAMVLELKAERGAPVPVNDFGTLGSGIYCSASMCKSPFCSADVTDTDSAFPDERT